MESETERIKWEEMEKRLSSLESIAHPSVNWELKIRLEVDNGLVY